MYVDKVATLATPSPIFSGGVQTSPQNLPQNNLQNAATTATQGVSVKNWIWALAFLIIGAAALGQTTNTLYARNFPGSTVGQKVAAAQSHCQSASTCVIVIDASLASYADGTMPAKCTGCLWLDYRGGSFSPGVLNGVTNATELPGSDIGAQVNAYVTQNGPVGTLFIPSGTYTYSTPIDIQVSGTEATLSIVCSDKGVTLDYTGSGAAFTVDDVNGATAMKMSIKDCSFVGSSAAAGTDGIVMHTTGPATFEGVSVKGFPADNIYLEGALETSLYNVRLGRAGEYNLHLAPDTATGISTNAMHMFGGSLYYGGLANFWDAGNGTYQDQNNTLIGVTEEMTTWTPQNIVEDTANDAIQDGYIEYINTSGTQVAPLYATLVGNFSGSGLGTSSNNTATAFTFSNNICGTPTAQAGQITYEVYAANTTSLKVDGVNDFGAPTYGIGFYASGSNLVPQTGSLSIAWKTAMYQNAPTGGLLYQTPGQSVGAGEYALDNTVSPEFGTAKIDQATLGATNIASGGTETQTDSGLWTFWFSPIVYFDAVGPNTSTYGEFKFRQLENGGTSYFDSLFSDSSGDWTAHGYIAATGFTGTQSVTFTPSSGWGTGATASCVSGYHCDQLSGMVEVVAGTGATVSPAPTVTFTWATALPQDAVCTVSNVYWAGSLLAGPQFVQGTTTSAEIAFAGITTAPSSGAESFVTYVCGE